jgi:hypothetical protein
MGYCLLETIVKKLGLNDFHCHDIRHDLTSHLLMNVIDLNNGRRDAEINRSFAMNDFRKHKTGSDIPETFSILAITKIVNFINSFVSF